MNWLGLPTSKLLIGQRAHKNPADSTAALSLWRALRQPQPVIPSRGVPWGGKLMKTPAPPPRLTDYSSRKRRTIGRPRNSRNRADSSHSCRRTPPLYALRDDAALPSAVRAPVDLLHGCHWRIFSACRACCSAVHFLAAMITSNSSFR